MLLNLCSNHHIIWMENVAIKGRDRNDIQHKNWKGEILRIWITIIRHGRLGHEVQESWPYLSKAMTLEPHGITAVTNYCNPYP